MMKHPNEEQLMAWADGERDEIAFVGDHLAACSECTATVDAFGASRSWSPSVVNVWAEDKGNELAGDDAWMDALTARAMNERPAVTEKPSEKTSKPPKSNVVAPRGGFRRWQPAAAGVALAAAAAGIFMIVRPHGPAKTGTAPSSVVASNPPNMTAAAGSTLLSVQSDQSNETVSVFEVEGETDGSTVTVVWISEN